MSAIMVSDQQPLSSSFYVQSSVCIVIVICLCIFYHCVDLYFQLIFCSLFRFCNSFSSPSINVYQLVSLYFHSSLDVLHDSRDDYGDIKKVEAGWKTQEVLRRTEQWTLNTSTSIQGDTSPGQGSNIVYWRRL